MRRVRVLAPYFAPAVDGGGPIRTLGALVRTAPADVALEVVTRDRDLGAAERLVVPTCPVVDGAVTIRYLDTRGVSGAWSLVGALRARPAPELTYVNSVFDARFSVLPLLLRRFGVMRSRRVLLAPRGELDPGALALGNRKKRCYLRAARALGVFHGVTWHASTEDEADHVRAAVGGRTRVVVRENETSLPDRARRRAPERGEVLELVTVGRISPKKRTHLLIEALADVRRRVRLQVVGPAIDTAYARRCLDAARRLPTNVEVAFTGTLEHDDVLECIARSHAMVTATAAENFGHTVAETLSVGRPVLLPDTTPWSDRVRDGGGAVVDDGAWTATIESWAAMPAPELARRAGAAADVYDRWRSTVQQPHVFDLVFGDD
ncbi:glycosyltransferase [Curtobacterium sp. NPDC090217]|uniref:glycosyltransferase n=1 Tax=Curtobacterium sp. NPDC090217 TaxID=3363970 RepID=UPI0038308A6D